MSAYATTGRPPWAVTMWADNEFVYVELPCKEGPPYITKYSLTSAGLDKALKTMQQVHKSTGAKAYTAISREPLRSKAFSEGQRESTRAVLKRLKII